MTNNVLVGVKDIGQRLFGGYAELLRIPHTARFSVGSVIACMPFPMVGMTITISVQHYYGNYSLAGALTAVQAIALAVASPVLGKLVDKFGQRQVSIPTIIVWMVAAIALVSCITARVPSWILFCIVPFMAAIPPWGAMSRQRWTTLLKGDAEKTNRALSLSGVFDECMWVIGNPLASTLAVISGLLAFSFTGMCVVIGALMFLGCPLRMVIRIGGGDWNALVGLVGFIVGILVGVVFLKKGFTLGRSYKQTLAEGAAFPVVYVLLFVLWLAAPAIFKFSEKGPGSMHAAWGLALVAGLVVGALCQRSRMCMVGGIRNAVMFKDFGLVAGFVTIILTVLVGNLILGKFNPGFTGQPVAHNDGLWNFLGTALMGWGCVLLGGCPLRQLILAGQGESDSAVTVLGMMCGAAFCHNLKLASSADGPTGNGKIAVIVGFVVVLVVSLLFTKKAEE